MRPYIMGAYALDKRQSSKAFILSECMTLALMEEGILCMYTPTLECYIKTCVYVDVCPLVGYVLVGYGYPWYLHAYARVSSQCM